MGVLPIGVGLGDGVCVSARLSVAVAVGQGVAVAAGVLVAGTSVSGREGRAAAAGCSAGVLWQALNIRPIRVPKASHLIKYLCLFLMSENVGSIVIAIRFRQSFQLMAVQACGYNGRVGDIEP